MGADLELTTRVLAAVAVIVLMAGVCGRVVQWIGQPRVVGEMVAGVLLGPTLLGQVAPELQRTLFSSDVKSVLYVLASLGLTFYMFLVGTEVERTALDRSGTRKALVLALSGIIPTFALGVGAALLYQDQLAVPGVSTLVYVLFLSGALSITAFPMLARILQERGIVKTRIGSLTLVAAAVDDAFAWALLAFIIAVAGAGTFLAAGGTILGATLFAVLMLTLGRRALAPLGRRVEQAGEMTHGAMVVVLLTVLAAGWFTDLIGIFSVFGGFIAGLAMPRSPVFRRELQHRLSQVSVILLLPIFFAYSGLNTHLGGLSSLELLIPFLIVLLAAVLGKYGGCAAGVRLLGFKWRYASAVGGLMTARGLMILAFINIGMAHGLLTQELFSMLVLVAVITTAAAMPIYRLSLPLAVELAEVNGPTAGKEPTTPTTAVPVRGRAERGVG